MKKLMKQILEGQKVLKAQNAQILEELAKIKLNVDPPAPAIRTEPVIRSGGSKH